MTTAIRATALTRRFRTGMALDGVTLEVQEHTICGLLGRNGAGKTTFMSLLSGQDLPSGGTVEVFGQTPHERAEVLNQVCFIRDNQRYPDEAKLKHVLRVAPAFFPQWDQELADRLIDDFRLPSKPVIKKFSRGQLSALGIVLGMASHAPITCFDEPYLGLDPTARHVFYDRLIADYAEHPRTIVLSTHLIDEMAPLLEQVVVIDRGRVRLDTTAEAAGQLAFTASGSASAVDAFADGRPVLRTHGIGGLKSVTIEAVRDAETVRAADAAGVELSPVSLQELVASYGAAPDADRETEQAAA